MSSKFSLSYPISYSLCLTLLSLNFINTFPLYSETSTLLKINDHATEKLDNASNSTSYLDSGGIDHPVSTKNPEAQKSFNIGLSYVFAYNHDLAFKEFEKASKLDPNLAMAYWGMALALGQNINTDVTPENELKAYDYIQKAIELIDKVSKSNKIITDSEEAFFEQSSINQLPYKKLIEVERDYIHALSQRYTNDENADLIPFRTKYFEAMKKLNEKYPQDLDAACLYAESILNLKPWDYWTWDGKPQKGTIEAIVIIENILRMNPNHIGANHFNIHAWEESPTPERALISAFRLVNLYPQSGHLMHMPCHIFFPCGYYEEAIQTNLKAIAADLNYIKEYGIEGEYPLHYLPHNMVMLARGYMLNEQYTEALRAANQLQSLLKPHFKTMPHLTKFMVLPIQVNLYFECWDEVLKMNKPETDNSYVLSYWHFSQSLAYANLGKLKESLSEKNLMSEQMKKVDPDLEISNNPAIEILKLGQLILDAEMDRVNGDMNSAIEKLKNAISVQERLKYDEPPAWYQPLANVLGKALLSEERYEEAEAVYAKALAEWQRNDRLLKGLALSYKGQGKAWNAFWVLNSQK